jgi:F420-dependent oxidoreductase-like protein
LPKKDIPAFGFVLPQGWRWLDKIPGDTPVEQYRFSRTIARIADGLGYESAYAYDHLRGGANYAKNHDKNFFECFSLLSAILCSTMRIKVGQIVTCNSYRNPALLAKIISTMDVISNGRTELGIGAGWYEEEYLSYGYKYPSSIIRIEQLDESLAIIKSLWTQPSCTYFGKHYVIRNAGCNPKPIQRPWPNIMVGGTGEKHLLGVVAKHADRYNHPFAPPEQVKRKISVLKDRCDTIGRDEDEIEKSILIRCLIEEDENELHKDIENLTNKTETLQQLEQRLSAFIGQPDYIRSKILDYIDIGVTHFIIHFLGLKESTLKIFDSKVIEKI